MDTASVGNRIAERLMDGIFGQKLIENMFRGVWAEHMVAEAIGEKCVVVSQGGHPWDLQIGLSQDRFPKRIRIQVKNTARLQTWHQVTGHLTNCHWVLPMGPKPFYFETYNKNVPCEDYGHLCDLYVLCHHPADDPDVADHRDPYQWKFYVVPVTPEHDIFPVKSWPEGQKAHPTYTVVPKSLEKGIQGHPPIAPLTYDELKLPRIRSSLGI